MLTSMGSSFRIPHIRTTGRHAAAAFYKENADIVHKNPLLYKSINEMTARASVFRKSHYQMEYFAIKVTVSVPQETRRPITLMVIYNQ